MSKLLATLLVLAHVALAGPIQCNTGSEPGCAPSGSFRISDPGTGTVLATGTLIFTYQFGQWLGEANYSANGVAMGVSGRASDLDSYSISVSANTWDRTLDFEFQMDSPFPRGPFNTATTSHSTFGYSYFSDPPNPSLLPLGSHLVTMRLDGNLLDARGAGCPALVVNVPSVCEPPSYTAHPVLTGPVGMLSFQAGYRLTPYTQGIFSAGIYLENQVPEPATNMTLAAGLALVVWRLRRPRA